MAKKKKTLKQRWKQFKRSMKMKHRARKMDRKHPADQACRIGIVMLMAQSWNSYETLYREAKARPNTDVVVYVLPEQLLDGGMNLSRYGEVLAFFEGKGIEVVPLYDTATGEWKSPDCVKADYLFYDKPYVEMYPYWLRPERQANWAKICYIPYGFLLTDQKPLLDVVFRKDFFAYTHTFFAPWGFVARYAENLFREVKGRRHHVVDLGYPRFDLIQATEGTAIHEKSLATFLWTPRWTIPGKSLDNCTAHSSFLDFKDLIPKRAADHVDEYWLLRPHPLAFDNYIKFNLMTEDEVTAYKKAVDDLPNAEMDKNPDYWDGFSQADVLVTDFSSLIVEYAATGKPIFYCGAMEALPMPELREIVYHTPTWEQVEKQIAALRLGEDPKSEQRVAFARQLRGDGEIIGEKILQYIVQDFYKMNNRGTKG